MAKIIKSIEIEAPPEKVFAFVISDKMNDVWGEWYSGKWTSEEPVRVGSIGHFVGNPNFLKGEWDMEVTEFVKNKNMTMHTIGKSPMKSTVSMNLEPTTKGTKATYVDDYEVPYSILGKLIDKVKVSKDMEKAHLKLMENLKKTLEA
jgi:uncharacterized protein YndB with AHSA1/START domain